MGKFKDSRTAKNLLTAFAFETQARTRYNFYADRAREDNYIQIANIFDETADQEREHALRFFKFFNGGEYEVKWSFPAGVVLDTYANLKFAAQLEHDVQTNIYPGFAKIAEEEGFQRAADTLNAISVSERHHEALFRELAQNIKTERIFSREKTEIWRCLSCGYIHEGKAAPDKCPACVKPAGYFELLCDKV